MAVDRFFGGWSLLPASSSLNEISAGASGSIKGKLVTALSLLVSIAYIGRDKKREPTKCPR